MNAAMDVMDTFSYILMRFFSPHHLKKLFINEVVYPSPPLITMHKAVLLRV